MATSPAPIIIDGGSIRSLILIYLALVAAASKIRSTLGREGYIYGYRLLGVTKHHIFCSYIRTFLHLQLLGIKVKSNLNQTKVMVFVGRVCSKEKERGL